MKKCTKYEQYFLVRRGGVLLKMFSKSEKFPLRATIFKTGGCSVAGPHKSPRPRIILLVKFSILKIFMNSADLNSDNSSYSDFRMINIFQKCFII